MTDTSVESKGLHFVIDKSLCSGHGRCYTLAPRFFDADDIGYGEVKDQVITAEERVKMEDIAAACPEGAISIEEGEAPA